MKIPDGMTEEETLAVIKKVINRIAHNYTFYGFTGADLKQESFIICMDALERYDNVHRLENFLSSNLSNRLKNFIRDNHFKPTEEEKGKIIQPAQLDNEHSILDSSEKLTHLDESMDYRAMVDVINRKLPANMRMDYLKMISDVYVSGRRRDDILVEIKEILKDNGFDVDGEGDEEG